MELGMVGNYAVEWLLNNPAVAGVLGSLAALSVTGLAISRLLETVAVALRPMAKMTESKGDDKLLEKGIYWLDAVGDVFEKFSIFKWVKGYEVIVRIKKDLGKPYSKRRRE